jgi:hydroxyacylglutathione hydrolase
MQQCHHAYVLEHGGDPIGLFAGGSLMVGTVGRTDLDGPDSAEPLVHEMFRSLRRFDDLPDDLAVYPTHGAGSVCGAAGSSERTTTLGAERTSNPLFAIGAEDDVVETLLGGFGSFPSYFLRLPELNRLGPPRLDQTPSLERLSTAALADHMAGGALIVDARPMKHFGAGHIPGSMSNTLRPAFPSWLGWLTEPGQPLVFLFDEVQDRSDLVRQCLDVGVENLLGELDAGIDAWCESGRPIAQLPIVDSETFAPTAIDVRQRNEYQEDHIPGAINVELGSVIDAARTVGPVTVMCGHGERAMTTASILTTNGHADVSVFDGGPDTWAAATGRDLQAGP